MKTTKVILTAILVITLLISLVMAELEPFNINTFFFYGSRNNTVFLIENSLDATIEFGIYLGRLAGTTDDGFSLGTRTDHELRLFVNNTDQVVLNKGNFTVWGNITATANITADEINASIDCKYITGGSDDDYCADATGGGGGGAKSIIAGKGTAAVSADAMYHPVGEVAAVTTFDEEYGMEIPFAATIHNLTFWSDAAQGSGDICNLTIQKASTCAAAATFSTLINCTIGNAEINCRNKADSGSVSADECIRIFFDEAGATCSLTPAWSFVIEPT